MRTEQHDEGEKGLLPGISLTILMPSPELFWLHAGKQCLWITGDLVTILATRQKRGNVCQKFSHKVEDFNVVVGFFFSLLAFSLLGLLLHVAFTLT